MRREDILAKMLDYDGYVSTNQLRSDLGVPNSSNSEEYISFRQKIKDLEKDGLLEYDDNTKKTQEAYRPEYRESVINNQFGDWKVRITNEGIREVREENSVKNQAKNENSSEIHIERARDVHIDQRQTIDQKGHVVEYQGEKEDNSFIEFLCKTILENLGVKKTIISGLASFLIGVIGFFASINSLFPTVKIFQYLPQLPSSISSPIFTLSIILLIIGSLLLGLFEYKQGTRCSKCGEFYALEEYKNPTVKEIKVKDGTRVNGIQYLKCSKCGNEQTREFSYLIEDEAS